MKTERHLLITISAGDKRCGFCLHLSGPRDLCNLFQEPLSRAQDAKSPAALLRCPECLDAEQKASKTP